MKRVRRLDALAPIFSLRFPWDFDPKLASRRRLKPPEFYRRLDYRISKKLLEIPRFGPR